ncbi:hypothetical protein ACOME3_008668 [Neoechinorhynchus agilis]
MSKRVLNDESADEESEKKIPLLEESDPQDQVSTIKTELIVVKGESTEIEKSPGKTGEEKICVQSEVKPEEQEKVEVETDQSKPEDSNRGNPENASCVVHISSIPHDVPDQKLAFIGLAFGELHCILYLKNKGQAFISFRDINDAAKMVNYFAKFTPVLLGSRLHVQFSNHKQINLSQMSPSVAHTQLALKCARELKAKAASGEVGSVARLLIHDMVMGVSGSISVDTLYQILSKFGPVLKIVIGKRTSSSLLAFVQMRTGSDVGVAIKQLNGLCLFGGGFSQCSIDRARTPCLFVRANCVRCRDYTNPCLLSPEVEIEAARHQNGPIPTVDLTDDIVEYVPDDETPKITSNPAQQAIARRKMTTLTGADLYEPVEQDDPSNDNAQLEEEQAATAAMLYAAAAAAASRPLMSTIPQLASSMNPFGLRTALAAAAAFFDSPDTSGFRFGYTGPVPEEFLTDNGAFVTNRSQKRVLLVSNLNEAEINTDNLFILFGVYGDVKRVKILFNKKDTALVQFNTSDQAETALRLLDGISIFGRRMKISYSKHLNIQRVKDTDNPELTKDFEDSSLHRFKKPGSKNYMNIFPPNPSLHLSNLSDEVTEEEIKTLFSKYGRVEHFRFFENSNQMARITMDSIESACHALMACHNYPMSKSRYLRMNSKPENAESTRIFAPTAQSDTQTFYKEQLDDFEPKKPSSNSILNTSLSDDDDDDDDEHDFELDSESGDDNSISNGAKDETDDDDGSGGGGSNDGTSLYERGKRVKQQIAMTNLLIDTRVLLHQLMIQTRGSKFHDLQKEQSTIPIDDLNQIIDVIKNVSDKIGIMTTVLSAIGIYFVTNRS